MSSDARPTHVYLVGAGPGDPDLLTLRALHLLQTTDVILPDDLVSDEILDLASPSAEIIPVGKRCGQPRITQSGIHDLASRAVCGFDGCPARAYAREHALTNPRPKVGE